MLLKEALLPEDFGVEADRQQHGRTFIKVIKRNREFAAHTGALFKAWNDTKLVGKEATNGPVVK